MRLAALLPVLLLPACAGDGGGPVPVIRTAQLAPDPQPGCLAWRAEAIAGGEPVLLVGRGCKRADGAWDIAEGRTQTVYTPPAPGFLGLYDDAFFGPPIGTSLGVRVFVDAAGRLLPDPRATGVPRGGYRFDQPAEGRLGRGPLPQP